jgi:hypothetical protein
MELSSKDRRGVPETCMLPFKTPSRVDKTVLGKEFVKLTPEHRVSIDSLPVSSSNIKRHAIKKEYLEFVVFQRTRYSPVGSCLNIIVAIGLSNRF